LNISFCIFVIILIYVCYRIEKSNYRRIKRNELKFSEDGVEIPEHLCSKYNKKLGKFQDSVVTFEEMEEYCQNTKKEKKITYKTVRWVDIQRWEYGFARSDTDGISFSNWVWLSIDTKAEKFSISDVNKKPMLKHFREHVKEKQIKNFDNDMFKWGFISIIVVVSFGILIKTFF